MSAINMCDLLSMFDSNCLGWKTYQNTMNSITLDDQFFFLSVCHCYV